MPLALPVVWPGRIQAAQTRDRGFRKEQTGFSVDLAERADGPDQRIHLPLGAAEADAGEFVVVPVVVKGLRIGE